MVIPNAIDVSRFATPDPAARAELERLFTRPVRRIVGAAGRLSPEKGFKDLVDAAARGREVRSRRRASSSSARASFGRRLRADRRAGPGRPVRPRRLPPRPRPPHPGARPAGAVVVHRRHAQRHPRGLRRRRARGGHRSGRNAGDPRGGLEGQLVPLGDPQALSRRIQETLADEEERRGLGILGRQRIRERFTFPSQAALYQKLLSDLVPGSLLKPDRSVMPGTIVQARS